MKALKKLIPAAAMLLLCAAMMTTATFAWFSMNNAVTVNQIEGTITAPVNLQISSAVDSGWTNSLTGVTGSAGSNGISPVTTTDMATWKTTNKGVMDTGATAQDAKLSTVTLDAAGKCTAVTPGGNDPNDDDGSWEKDQYFYTTYTIYLKNVGGTATDVYIDVDNTAIAANSATTASGDLLKSVTFAAQVTGGTSAKNQQFVQDSTDTMTKVTDYIVVSGATNDNVLVNIAPQAVATVKIIIWMEGTSTHCKTSNVKDATLKFDFKLGFTTVAKTA